MRHLKRMDGPDRDSLCIVALVSDIFRRVIFITDMVGSIDRCVHCLRDVNVLVTRSD